VVVTAPPALVNDLTMDAAEVRQTVTSVTAADPPPGHAITLGRHKLGFP